MRTRLAALFTLVLLFSAALPASLPAHAATHVFAQDTGNGDPTGEEDTTSTEEQGGGGKGQSDPAAESGAKDEEAATETGPPWTYQMAWLGLALLIMIALGIGLAYRKLVVERQRVGT